MIDMKRQNDVDFYELRSDKEVITYAKNKPVKQTKNKEREIVKQYAKNKQR